MKLSQELLKLSEESDLAKSNKMQADLQRAHKTAKSISAARGVVQHINKNKNTKQIYVSDWYDDDETIGSYNNGKWSEAGNKIAEGREDIGPTADKCEEGDIVAITGNVEHEGDTGEITKFGTDKKFVVVKLFKDNKEYSFHSSDVTKESDDADNGGSEDGEDDDVFDKEEQDTFYVAFYDEDEQQSWIGEVTKADGGKWHEKPYKGKADYKWGTSYMSYLKPSDIMSWIHKDYRHGMDIEGPIDTAEEAEEYVRNNFGELKESAEPVDFTEPKLGTVKATLMLDKEPTVQVQVFKQNKTRGDSYWVTKEVKKFKTEELAQAYIDRINKGVTEAVIEKESTLTASNLKSNLKDTLEDIVKEYSKHAKAGQTSVPSAPNTMAFKAIKYGMIELAHGTTVHGSYGMTTKFDLFVKVGGQIPHALFKAMVEDLRKDVGYITGQPVKGDNFVIKTSDGYDFVFDTTDGSAWSGFGFRIRKSVKESVSEGAVKVDFSKSALDNFEAFAGKKVKTGRVVVIGFPINIGKDSDEDTIEYDAVDQAAGTDLMKLLRAAGFTVKRFGDTGFSVTVKKQVKETAEGDAKNAERLKAKEKMDFNRMMAGAMSRDEFNKRWKKGKYAEKSGKYKLDPTGMYHNMIKTVEAKEETLGQKIANKIMGAAPREPKYKVGQVVKFQMDPPQKDGSGVGKITKYDKGSGFYTVNGRPVNHFEIKEVMKEEAFTDFDDWKAAVLNSYPAQAKKMKFKGRMEGGKDTISAEVPGEDRSYGVWDADKEKGVVLSEAAVRKGSVAYEIAMKRKEEERKPENIKKTEKIGSKNHMVGTAKVVPVEEAATTRMSVDKALEIASEKKSTFSKKDYYDQVVRNEGLSATDFNRLVTKAINDKGQVKEGKEENIAKLRKDYKDAKGWVEMSRSDRERRGHEATVQKIWNHAKTQYKIDLDRKDGKLDEASMGMLMSQGLKKAPLSSNGEVTHQEKMKKAEARDAAWWKAQSDASKAGKTHFEFDGKMHPLKGKPANEKVAEGISPYKIGAKVKIVSGPKDCVGKEGYIGEIRTGPAGDSPKTFTIDYDHDEKSTQPNFGMKSVQLKAKDIKLVKSAKE